MYVLFSIVNFSNLTQHISEIRAVKSTSQLSNLLKEPCHEMNIFWSSKTQISTFWMSADGFHSF